MIVKELQSVCRKYFFDNQVVGFLLMIAALVLFFSWFRLQTMEGYSFMILFLLFASSSYHYGKSFHEQQLFKIYMMFGLIALVLGLLFQIGILSGYILVTGWGYLMKSICVIISLLYILSLGYQFLVDDREKDLFGEDITFKQLATFGCLMIIIAILYYLGYLGVLASFRWLTIIFVVVRKGGYRYFALGGLGTLLVTIVFLMIPNESNANIAATYCYYYLCATVVFALCTKKNEGN